MVGMMIELEFWWNSRAEGVFRSYGRTWLDRRWMRDCSRLLENSSFEPFTAGALSSPSSCCLSSCQSSRCVRKKGSKYDEVILTIER